MLAISEVKNVTPQANPHDPMYAKYWHHDDHGHGPAGHHEPRHGVPGYQGGH
jgi:hypothetical protein